MNVYRTAIVKQNDGGVFVWHMANDTDTHEKAAEYLKNEYGLKVVKMWKGYVGKRAAENWLYVNRRKLYDKFIR